MAWFLLVIAGLLEIGWAIGLKYTDGFTRFWPTAGTLAARSFSVAAGWPESSAFIDANAACERARSDSIAAATSRVGAGFSWPIPSSSARRCCSRVASAREAIHRSTPSAISPAATSPQSVRPIANPG